MEEAAPDAEERALRYVALFAATRVDADLWKERATRYQAEAERWERDFHRLRDRRAVRAALKVAGAFRPLLGGSRRDDA